MSIINVHAPVNCETGEQTWVNESFFRQLNDVYRREKTNSFVIILGDFNAKLGQQSTINSHVGRFAIGKQNFNGLNLHKFLRENDLVAVNTVFQKKRNKLVTWTGTTHIPHKNKYLQHLYTVPTNQIDYIITQNHHKKIFTNCEVKVNTLANSDHRLLHGCINLKNRYRYISRRIVA